jgi:hypothetical protein
VPGRNLFTVCTVLEPRNNFLVGALTVSLLLLVPQPALAYGGPGAGLEFVPYFLSLVFWVALAAGAVVMWPVYTLLRWFRGTNAMKNEVKNEATAATVPDAPAPAPRTEDDA